MNCLEVLSNICSKCKSFRFLPCKKHVWVAILGRKWFGIDSIWSTIEIINVKKHGTPNPYNEYTKNRFRSVILLKPVEDLSNFESKWWKMYVIRRHFDRLGVIWRKLTGTSSISQNWSHSTKGKRREVTHI